MSQVGGVMKSDKKTRIIEYEVGGKVIPVRVFVKKRISRVVAEHKKSGDFAPVPLKSIFAMILNGDRR